MVSKMIITCTGCGKKIQGPVTLQGKKIRCKVCATVFQVPAPSTQSPAAEAKGKKVEEVLDVQPVEEKKKEEAPPIAVLPFDEDEDGKNPYGISDQVLSPRCPHCANDMEADDVVCLHCGYNIATRERFRTVKTIEHTGMDWTLWLAPGILCVIADFILLACIILLWVFFPKLQKDFESDWYGDVFGLWARIWGSVICLFMIFFATRFAIKRLILHPRPPEKFKN
jgi:hypothetical protein